MKETRCLAYNKNTETELVENGVEYGKYSYKEVEVILSEYCSVTGKINDFDCEKCPLRKELLRDENE